MAIFKKVAEVLLSNPSGILLRLDNNLLDCGKNTNSYYFAREQVLAQQFELYFVEYTLEVN